MELKLKVKLRKRVVKKVNGKEYYQYYITIPPKVVEVLELEKYVDKDIEIILKVNN